MLILSINIENMRKTSLVTISLPRPMASEAEKIARKQGMTRSELLRSALRRYIEEIRLEEAVSVFEKEQREGKLQILKGSLVDLMES